MIAASHPAHLACSDVPCLLSSQSPLVTSPSSPVGAPLRRNTGADTRLLLAMPLAMPLPCSLRLSGRPVLIHYSESTPPRPRLRVLHLPLAGRRHRLVDHSPLLF